MKLFFQLNIIVFIFALSFFGCTLEDDNTNDTFTRKFKITNDTLMEDTVSEGNPLSIICYYEHSFPSSLQSAMCIDDILYQFTNDGNLSIFKFKNAVEHLYDYKLSVLNGECIHCNSVSFYKNSDGDSLIIVGGIDGESNAYVYKMRGRILTFMKVLKLSVSGYYPNYYFDLDKKNIYVISYLKNTAVNSKDNRMILSEFKISDSKLDSIILTHKYYFSYIPACQDGKVINDCLYLIYGWPCLKDVGMVKIDLRKSICYHIGFSDLIKTNDEPEGLFMYKNNLYLSTLNGFVYYINQNILNL